MKQGYMDRLKESLGMAKGSAKKKVADVKKKMGEMKAKKKAK